MLIAEVVAQQLAHSLQSASAGSKNPSGHYVLPKRTPEEQMERNKAAIEGLDK
ncbi:hypothetical protein [Kamptonema formosum]|uniref:hypothetical protein n=1 Tax=Kamptonema formosum TaxID=331992 RepID=UPI000344C427|nr:hypothetical protein [Oscillatoria sp. PCC 10802]